MNNIENYIGDLVKRAVREVIQEEFEKLSVLLMQSHEKTEVSKVRQKNDIFEGTKIIRPKELATLLSVSLATLYRMENNGLLPPKYKISSRAVGWLNIDILQWLLSNVIR